ncbi:hypothetical protein F4553_006625 [Allocatelliglobosispora scoriae]|uniref:MPT63-like domain-containing protein n=1 Tax=Allocatelliglobosispora scoriae TaxID=643052 RepID=A0A841C2X0_9ACTN|nr:DUF4352 domain-containing protein [Allocatelliglobosispora scoriae]MBB5873191.1 hypothetical protein [Allocatelliglobosispora scoriae]
MTPGVASSRAVTGAAVVAALVMSLACGIKPERSTVSDGPSAAAVSAAAAPVAKLGQTITLSGGLGDNRVAVTVFSLTTRSSAVDAAWVKPAKGVFAVVKVEMKVVRGKTHACSCDFALVAADGSLFEPVWPIGFDEAMQSVTLNTGEKVAGLVVFDVPAAAAKSATIQLRPDWTNDVRGRWQS